MIQKALIIVVLVLFFYYLIFPNRLPRLFRRAGRSAGDLGRAGKEIVTGEEVEGSPLARYEAGIGEVLATKLAVANPRCADARLQAWISSIGGRLAAQAHRSRIPYGFTAVEAAEPNAFAVPGGAVFITRPLIDLCGGSEDAVACVLGHEVIHIDRCHAIRNLAAGAAAKAGLNVLLLGRGALLARLAGGVESMLVQGYRQDQEFEADLFGTRLARLAGFDPRAMAGLLEGIARLAPDGTGPIAEVLSYFRAHPPTAERIARLRREWS